MEIFVCKSAFSYKQSKAQQTLHLLFLSLIVGLHVRSQLASVKCCDRPTGLSNFYGFTRSYSKCSVVSQCCSCGLPIVLQFSHNVSLNAENSGFPSTTCTSSTLIIPTSLSHMCQQSTCHYPNFPQPHVPAVHLPSSQLPSATCASSSLAIIPTFPLLRPSRSSIQKDERYDVCFPTQ